MNDTINTAFFTSVIESVDAHRSGKLKLNSESGLKKYVCTVNLTSSISSHPVTSTQTKDRTLDVLHIIVEDDDSLNT